MTQINRINGLIGSIAIKAPCRAATTATIILSGEQTIDGVSVVAEDRVLVKNQTLTTENGIYNVSATSWTRAPDFNGERDIVKGTVVRITEGTASSGLAYEVTSSGVTIGVSSIIFGIINFPFSSIDGAIIGATTPAAATVTAFTSTGNATFDGNISISGGSITGMTDITIADGGTGQSTAQAAIDALTAVSGATNEHVLTKDTATGNAIFKIASTSIADGSITAAKLASDAVVIASGTKIDTTSGTSHDFTGIPSWVKKITLMFEGVSTSGTSDWLVQLGDSGGIETTGYFGSGSSIVSTAVGSANYTTGLGIRIQAAANIGHGSVVLTNLDSNIWALTATLGLSNTTVILVSASSKSLSDVLDRIRLTTIGGTDTFDAGSINILME